LFSIVVDQRPSLPAARYLVHPPRRRCCAVTTAALAADNVCRVLFPAQGGGGRETKRGGNRGAPLCSLVVFAGLGLLSFLCDNAENWPFLAIIDDPSYTLLPLKKRYCAMLCSQKICNPFL
jgi:hypothetical protein